MEKKIHILIVRTNESKKKAKESFHTGMAIGLNIGFIIGYILCKILSS
jgi:hypothetical protein